MFPSVAHVPLLQSTGVWHSVQQPRPGRHPVDPGVELCSAARPYALTVPVKPATSVAHGLQSSAIAERFSHTLLVNGFHQCLIFFLAQRRVTVYLFTELDFGHYGLNI